MYVCLVPMYTDLGSRIYVVGQKPYLNYFDLLFHLFAYLTLFFIIFTFECDSDTILHLIGSLKLSFHCSLIQIVNLISSYSFSYFGRGSTNYMAEWYGALTVETIAHIRAVGFEPIIRLFLERSAGAFLVQSLAKR